jgi:methionine salvage enolase-phosphatase E1
MGQVSNQQDMYNSAANLAARGAQISTQMTNLAQEASGGVTQERLTQIQIQLQDLQRQAEMIKEIQGQLKKNQETNNKSPQS